MLMRRDWESLRIGRIKRLSLRLTNKGPKRELMLSKMSTNPTKSSMQKKLNNLRHRLQNNNKSDYLQLR
jgi:hypothetical protein